MAQKVQTVLVDDIEGTEIKDGGETVRFAVDGTQYEIDLSEKNAATMRDTLKFYQDHARKVSGGRRQSSSQSTTRGGKQQLDAIRTWARENGYEVSDRGRIKKQIMQAYEAAH